MGCGKSKHADVASGNTVLKRKTSTVQSKTRNEIKAEIIKKNTDDDVIISRVVEKESEIVKEVGGSNDVKDNVENEHVQELAAEGNKAMPKNFEGEKDDSLEKSDQKMEVAIVKEKEIPKENIVTVEKPEGEKKESLKKNDEGVHFARKEKEVAEEKKTNSEDSESGKGDSLEENSQEVNDDAIEVKEPEEETQEENAAEEETLVKKEDNKKDMEALTSENEENVIKAEDNKERDIVLASDDEMKDLKVEKVQSGNQPSNDEVKTK